MSTLFCLTYRRVQIGFLNSGNPVRSAFATEEPTTVRLHNLNGKWVHAFLLPERHIKPNSKIRITLPKLHSTFYLGEKHSVEIPADGASQLELEVVLEQISEIRKAPSLENANIPLQPKIEIRKSDNITRANRIEGMTIKQLLEYEGDELALASELSKSYPEINWLAERTHITPEGTKGTRIKE